jgi:hypothetical protein
VDAVESPVLSREMIAVRRLYKRFGRAASPIIA